MQIFGLKTCDTCRKAVKALPDAAFVDVRAEGVSAEILTNALAVFGAKLVNTRSTTWRSLDEEARQTEPLALLQAHPALMKRPLILDGDQMYLGWDASVRTALGVA